jgi:hypothetical protein
MNALQTANDIEADLEATKRSIQEAFALGPLPEENECAHKLAKHIWRNGTAYCFRCRTRVYVGFPE